MLLEIRGMAENALATKAEHAAALGKLGGKARLTKMTAEDRSRVAKLAARARWAKKHGAPTPPTPTDPKGPHRDLQYSESGIMSTSERKPAVPVSVNSPRERGRASA